MEAVAVKLELKGVLQGVGFRPFVYRLARTHGLRGWVRNNGGGVEILAEGESARVERFVQELRVPDLPAARVESFECRAAPPEGEGDFEIRESGTRSDVEPSDVSLAIDSAPCSGCLSELFDPTNRRYGYPFITCTQCGPRYSIALRPPFDRERTAMGRFTMCDVCAREYDDPASARFHSQTNSCAECGPKLEILHPDSRSGGAIEGCVSMLRAGKIIALMGVGGFQLLADALNEDAVALLRRRKERGEKPFALLVATVSGAEAFCVVTEAERQALESPAAPIVLLGRRRNGASIAGSVAPGLRTLGIMLPSSPLHHLIARAFGGPLVATSGNRGEEPLESDVSRAVESLSGLADAFVAHDREIVNPVDDSVVRVIDGEATLLRRARGYVPGCFSIPSLKMPALALGGHLKNTVALGREDRLYLSPHVGSLETKAAIERWRREAGALTALYGGEKTRICVRDLHPDYASSIRAPEMGGPARKVQHHLAHVLSCLADHETAPPVLGVAWDGSGYGADPAGCPVWGGEFLGVTHEGACERVASLRPFRLIGGERAVREPRRAALGLLHASHAWRGTSVEEDLPRGLASSLKPHELRTFGQMAESGLNSPLATSVGRLFDAVSSLIGIRHICTYEGQAAIELEELAETAARQGPGYTPGYTMSLRDGASPWTLDWEPLLGELLADLGSGVPASQIAWRFHAGLASAIVAIANRSGYQRVALSGGVFQNRLLTELAASLLRKRGFEVLLHRRIPPNDGGISAGQVYAMALSRSDRADERSHECV